MESRHSGAGGEESPTDSSLAVRGEGTAAGTEQRAQRGRGSVVLSIVSIKGSHLPGWGEKQRGISGEF